MFIPGTYHTPDARLAEMTGHDAAYMPDYSTVLGQFSFPDPEMVAATEMAKGAKRMVEMANLPVIAGCDTGYDDIHNIHRVIREYEKVGIATVYIGGQTTPKRCGHIAGGQIVSREKAKARFETAIDAK